MERVKEFKVKDLQQVSEKVLIDYADFFKSAMKDSHHEFVFDRSRNSFVLLEIGWENRRRIHQLVIHLEIINNKIIVDWKQNMALQSDIRSIIDDHLVDTIKLEQKTADGICIEMIELAKNNF